jgi:general secretion pathway protein J
MRLPHRSADGGFTLLELVVAIAVFAVVAAMAYEGLRIIIKSRQQVDGELDHLADLQQAINIMSSDIRQIVLRPVRDNQGSDEPALLVMRDRASRLLFTRTGHADPLGLPRSGMQRIRYTLEGNTLVRSTYNTLDRAPGEQPIATPLLEGVTGFDIQLLDRTNVWRYDWPPPENTPVPLMPRAIRFNLTLPGQGSLSRILVLQP